MATAKQAKPRKFIDRVYPKEADLNPTLNPDNYPLWKAPKDWTEIAVGTFAVRREEALEMLLRRNPNNKVRFMPSWSKTLTGRMNAGDYNLMEIVEFDWLEFLGNGEHRLDALSNSNAIVLMTIGYGRNPDNFYKFDDNYKRSGGNIVGMHLKLEKKGDANLLSAAASWIIIYWSTVPLETRMKIEHVERINTVNNNPKMVQFLNRIRNYSEEGGVVYPLPTTETILVALMTLGAEVNETKTNEFIKRLIQNDGLRVGNPIKEYREFLVASKDSKGKNKVYQSFKIGQGLFAMREFFANGDKALTPNGRGVYLHYKPNKEINVPRLSQEHEELFADERKKLTAHAKNRLLELCVKPTPALTEVTALEGKFFSKTTLKGLAKLGITTISEITMFPENGLLTVLKSKSIDEVKDVLGGLDLQLKK